MFSVWKKLTGKQDDKPTQFPTGVAPIGESMQKKYAKGVQYNMKIIIKGDRNTGKTTLFHRLNGKAFKEEYIPTHEIQVTNVNWNYQGAADVVKVEVWDIVDKSEKKKPTSDSLKIANDDGDASPEASLPADNGMSLDAEFLNVYKGTHGVILTMDLTKAWTWTYVQRELEKIPLCIPVLVLGNFRDLGDRRVVQNDEVSAHIEHLDRPTGSAEVYYTESSMKDGFGLHFAYKYLNMPFLILQRETLLKQLEANTLEIEETRETLSFQSLSDEGGYTSYKDMLVNGVKSTDGTKTDEEEDATTPVTASEVEADNHVEESNLTATSPAIEVDTGAESTPSLPPLKIDAGKSLPVATVSPTVHTPPPVQQKESLFNKTMKIFTGKDNGAQKSNGVTPTTPDIEESDDVDGAGEFHMGQLSSDFLESKPTKSSKNQVIKTDIGSDDDEDNSNPMVAGFTDIVMSGTEDVAFEQQYSVEAEFEDFSDDERQELEQPNVSIIEKIKAERMCVKTPQFVPKENDYHEFESDEDDNAPNTDVVIDECDVESETYSIKSKESYPSTSSALNVSAPVTTITDVAAQVVLDSSEVDDMLAEQTESPSSSITGNHSKSSVLHVTNTTSEIPCVNDVFETNVSDDDEDDEDCGFVIAGDVDVDQAESWLVDDGSDHDSDHDTRTAATTEPHVNHVVEDHSTDSINNHLARDNTVNCTDRIAESTTNSNNPEPPALTFEVDELELFMKEQYDKSSPVFGEVQPPIAVPEPATDNPPTKKKKKKKKPTTDDSVPTTDEKKKKKKKPATNVLKDDNLESSATSTKKSKKLKSAALCDDVSSQNPDSEKEKRTKKVKKKEVSELDSFYEGL